MKSPAIAVVGMAVLMMAAALTGCSQSQRLPEPAVELPAALGSFTRVKCDYNPDIGDYQYKFELSEAQQIEFQRLLQADRWFDPGELPGRGHTSVLDADNGQDWNLTVGYWDDTYTIIALNNADQTQKILYFAPFEVQKAAVTFRDKLKQ